VVARTPKIKIYRSSTTKAANMTHEQQALQITRLITKKSFDDYASGLPQL
jgi:hypothetical protein